MTDYSYIGSELEIFSQATNWKAYYKQLIQHHFGAEVLEVGAGIGATTISLCDGQQQRWVCLEPDPALADQIEALIVKRQLPHCCESRRGTLFELGTAEKFDTIIYIDVLEHIKDDGAELARAAQHLKRGGLIVILSPAHQWLFTPFDEAIGHYRRYDKASLSAIIPAGLQLVKLIYLDSVGALASSGNRLLLKSSMPTIRQIALWDKMMIPLSRIVDPLLHGAVGKSILGVWRNS